MVTPLMSQCKNKGHKKDDRTIESLYKIEELLADSEPLLPGGIL